MARSRRRTPADAAQQERRAIVRDFIQRSRKEFQTADAASFIFREAMRRDQRFRAGGGNQWEIEDRTFREQEGRPCLEINRIPQFIRQVSNQNRANRSSIIVHARGNGASKDVANALQGVIRSVEVESDADIAYDTATDHQLCSGLGFVRIGAQWAFDEAMHQVMRIRRVRNPLSVFWDPSTQEADFGDCRWMHIIGAMGRDEYDDKYGSLSPLAGLTASLTEFMPGARDYTDWMPEGKVILAERYYVETHQRTLLVLDTGKTVWQEELQRYQDAYLYANPNTPTPRVLRSRQVERKEVFWALHNAVEILEGNEDRTAGRRVPGTRIPVYPLMGDEIDIDGVIDYRGMVRDAQHPQQMYNFWASSIAEAVALAPKAPWIAAKGQIERYLDDWKQANSVPKAVLYYDPIANGDTLVPPPQQVSPSPQIQAMVQGLSEANQDLMSVMGLFEPSLGQRGSHTESGKAREALQQQGVIANSNFLDNLQRLKRAVGRTLIEWAPEILDVPRLMHLVQPDGKQKEAVVYAGAENKPKDGEFGDISEMYDIGVGHYDVTVDTGPSYQTQQQATEAWLLELFKVLPGLAAIGADIVLENSDQPAAKQLAARARKALPPQFQDEDDPEAQVPMLQSKVAQLTQLVQHANQAIGAMADALKGKQLDNDTKKQVAMIQAQAQMATALAKIGNERDLAAFSAMVDHYETLVDQIHQRTVIDMQADDDRTAAALAHSQGMEAADQAHGQTLDAMHQKAGVDAALATHQQAITPPPAPGNGPA
jgi:hypothetical protein